MNGESSDLAKVVFGDVSPVVHSLWHCWHLCHVYKDCVWVSWKGMESNDKGPKGIKKLQDWQLVGTVFKFLQYTIAVGECRMTKELSTNSTFMTYTMVDSDWTSSAVNCTRVVDSFESKNSS